MADSRFGIFYVIVRIALVVLVILQMIFNIVGIIDCKHCSASSIVWFVFSFLALGVGLIGAWKEHFLFSIIFAVLSVVLVIFGWGISTLSAAGVVALILISILFTFMLWDAGKRDMNVPKLF